MDEYLAFVIVPLTCFVVFIYAFFDININEGQTRTQVYMLFFFKTLFLWFSQTFFFLTVGTLLEIANRESLTSGFYTIIENYLELDNFYKWIFFMFWTIVNLYLVLKNTTQHILNVQKVIDSGDGKPNAL